MDYPEALSKHNSGRAPIYRVVLWPHRSLTRQGFVIFIALTSSLLGLPLLAIYGSTALWMLLPFLCSTLALLWFFLMQSYKSGQLVEELSIWRDHMTLVRTTPYGPKERRRLDWQANPYWVEVNLRDQPVPNYLTLRGDGLREVELGAFLSADERATLKHELDDELKFLAVARRPL